MRRRSFLTAVLSALISPAALPRTAQARAVGGWAAAPSSRTRWRVRTSEGFDAIAFLGPLSGGELYVRYYAEDAAAFAPRLPAAVRRDIACLWAATTAEGFGLLAPNLCVLFSGGNDATLDAVLAALAAPD